MALFRKPNGDILKRLEQLQTHIDAEFNFNAKLERNILDSLTTMAKSIQTILDLLRVVIDLLKSGGVGHHPATAILFMCATLNRTKFWLKGVTKMQMTDIQSAVATIQAVDAEGNPGGTFDAPPAWSSSDPSIVTVEVAADGLSAVIASPSPAPLGSAVISVSAVVAGAPLSATLAVDIIASGATAINITTAVPTP